MSDGKDQEPPQKDGAHRKEIRRSHIIEASALLEAAASDPVARATKFAAPAGWGEDREKAPGAGMGASEASAEMIRRGTAAQAAKTAKNRKYFDENIMRRALATVGLEAGKPQADQFEGDFRSVAWAYQRAAEDGQTRYAVVAKELREIVDMGGDLDEALRTVRGITDLLQGRTKDLARGRLALRAIEDVREDEVREAAKTRRFSEEPILDLRGKPPEPGRPVSQFGRAKRLAELLRFDAEWEHELATRRGKWTAARQAKDDKQVPPVDPSISPANLLSVIDKVTVRLASAEEWVAEQQRLARIALERLPAPEAKALSIEGVVAVLGAIQLVSAWSVDRKPSQASENPVSQLVALIVEAKAGTSGRKYEDQLRNLISLYNAGGLQFLFEGRIPAADRLPKRRAVVEEEDEPELEEDRQPDRSRGRTWTGPLPTGVVMTPEEAAATPVRFVERRLKPATRKQIAKLRSRLK